ncbi:MAG: helix-turn-helix transcriptional regulator, partial [Clostridia bacterium]|nr:helix-turn-helix transcriptional regulator [Clostridia bacterium]
DYITELRITNAKDLLSVGTMPAGEIAEKCGFASQYYFSRIFRKNTGVTPSEYRNRYSEAVVT